MKNHRIASAAALAFLALAASGTGAWARTPIAAVVTDVSGKPRVRPEGETGTKTLKLKQDVYEGDVVTTGKNDLVALLFVGGAEVRVNHDSSFRLDSGGGAKPTSLFSKFGQAWTNLLHGNAQIEIRTPSAVCAVRGTQADVNISGDMTVKVYEGHVDFFNEQGTEHMVAGQISVVAPGRAPLRPTAMTPAQYGTWQNTLKPRNVAALRAALMKASRQERVLELKSNKNGKQTDIKLHFRQNNNQK